MFSSCSPLLVLLLWIDILCYRLCILFYLHSPVFFQFETGHPFQCYCGDYGDDPEKRPQAYCNTPCAGDSSEICGGAYIITVYKTFQHEEPTPSPAPGYLGCFADDKKSRIMTKRGSKKNMTREVSIKTIETRESGVPRKLWLEAKPLK